MWIVSQELNGAKKLYIRFNFIISELIVCVHNWIFHAILVLLVFFFMHNRIPTRVRIESSDLNFFAYWYMKFIFGCLIPARHLFSAADWRFWLVLPGKMPLRALQLHRSLLIPQKYQWRIIKKLKNPKKRLKIWQWTLQLRIYFWDRFCALHLKFKIGRYMVQNLLAYFLIFLEMPDIILHVFGASCRNVFFQFSFDWKS